MNLNTVALIASERDRLRARVDKAERERDEALAEAREFQRREIVHVAEYWAIRDKLGHWPDSESAFECGQEYVLGLLGDSAFWSQEKTTLCTTDPEAFFGQLLQAIRTRNGETQRKRNEKRDLELAARKAAKEFKNPAREMTRAGENASMGEGLNNGALLP